MKENQSRRSFLKSSLGSAAALYLMPSPIFGSLNGAKKLKFGLVTYQWGRDWDLKTLIANCEKAGYEGIELRTEHAHKVESNLSAAERSEVKKMFLDSRVECVGYGANFEYHSPDTTELRRNIDKTREYIRLCHDIGASGIKVKPNNLPDGVPAAKTIEQIASALNECGSYASDYGQLVRVEVHGTRTSEIPVMKAIFEQVNSKNVKICWNCNAEDLLPPGLEENFSSIRPWFGDTVHVRELNGGDYPYKTLFSLLNRSNYKGWILLEARTEPSDRLTAMKEQSGIFNDLINTD